MAKKTQPRSVTPFTGRRYGDFSVKVGIRDFMRGTLNVRPYVVGTIRIDSSLKGPVRIN